MNRLDWGLIVWGFAFFPLELTAHFWSRCPWPTFSSTVWIGIKDWHPLSYFVALALFVLWGHFDRHWSVLPLIAVAGLAALAIGVHLITR